jgi:hypothetical protein
MRFIDWKKQNVVLLIYIIETKLRSECKHANWWNSLDKYEMRNSSFSIRPSCPKNAPHACTIFSGIIYVLKQQVHNFFSLSARDSTSFCSSFTDYNLTVFPTDQSKQTNQFRTLRKQWAFSQIPSKCIEIPSKISINFHLSETIRWIFWSGKHY